MASRLRGSVELSETQQLVQNAVRDVCTDFDDEYWRTCDREGEYPAAFVDELAAGGWLGILIPEEYGGVGMTTEEVVVMMEEVAAGGGGFSGTQAIHGTIYNSVPLVKYGSEELKAELLPEVATGEAAVQSLALTEPNAGSDSLSIETRAERDGDGYVINGQKIWTSRVDQTDYALVIARTTPKADVEKRTQGLSMFLVDVEEAFDRGTLQMEPIEKTASNAVHAFELWFEDLRVPESALVGERDNGFYQLLDGLNEERLVIAAECIGLGELALERGTEYADQREVFGRKIGTNQAIQHPLAKAYARVQAAKEVVYNAAGRLETSERTDGGVQANLAKFLAAEACHEAADIAVQAHGGFGVAREYDVERYLREARLTRLVPIAQELALNYIGENALDLPRSY
ncbi:acyl-CoA dehydrogenase family protein [Natronomonas sp.]|uniref:acyl-CoA dehydrogenase family protein n=1 Tax=Natronomonas sp. TaxID=2184060 RepID=UPI00261BEB71|nr:acyl-CoA dehydrogenase family protein [Natronomonas sp.]